MHFRAHWALYPSNGWTMKVTLADSPDACDSEATKEIGRTDEENKRLCISRGFFSEGSISSWQEAVQRVLNATNMNGTDNDQLPRFFLTNGGQDPHPGIDC